jgi:hypothetical protein
MCDQCTSSLSTSAGSRRRRLWDLPQQCHCPVVGVCFPLAALRQLVNKALGGKAMADDYEVHVGAVAECTQRNRLSELMQKDLEEMYSRSITAFRVAKDTKAVASLWADAVRRGDLPGAFWATLTHPRCDEVLQEIVLRDMHMLQHQAGAAVRTDVTKFNELIKENSVLGRELGRVQERCTRALSEKSIEIEQLHTQLFHQRSSLIGKDSQIAFLLQDIAELKAALPDFESTSRMRKKVQQLTARQTELEATNTQLRQQLSETQRSLSQRESDAQLGPTVDRHNDTPAQAPITFHLKEKKILCVGGRNGSVASYRDVIEKAGGNFAHHDGGVEDKQSALDSVLAAADLVICQTGCISHNAYWRVKDFCKRNGTQCVFVENPSTSSLSRTLLQITANDIHDEVAEDAIGKQ